MFQFTPGLANHINCLFFSKCSCAPDHNSLEITSTRGKPEGRESGNELGEAVLTISASAAQLPDTYRA